MKLILFDIDGTILMTKGLGRLLLEDVLIPLFDRPITAERISFSGKTDPQIVQEILVQNGFSAQEASALTPDVLDRYIEKARQAITPRHVEVLPGVRALIDRLAAQDAVQLALLTGNHHITAYLKLEAAGLAAYFPFGAFGSDHADRAALPPIAVRRAHAYNGRTYAGKDVVIIGDSENDVRCGRGIGAFSVAVCTGFTTRDALAAEAPDVLLNDLCDETLFVEHVLSRNGTSNY